MTDTPTEPPAPRRDERVALPTRAPLHLEATVRALQRRPSHPVERWDGARYRRALRTPDGLALVEVDNAGSVDAPDVRCAIVHGPRSVRARDAIVRTLRTRLGLDVDPAPLERLTGAEPRLAELAAALRGMRPPRFDDLFEACASVVPFQQVSLAAGVTVLENRGDLSFVRSGELAIEGAVRTESLADLRDPNRRRHVVLPDGTGR